MLASLVADTLAALSPLVGRALTRAHVVELDCSRPGKWSRHITVDGADDEHESVAFATNADCREFVQRLLGAAASPYRERLALLVDRSIYGTRHPLRTAYSAKQGSTAAFRPLGPPAPCDAEMLARSMRTCFRVRSTGAEFYHQVDGGDWRLVSSAYLLHEPTAMRAPPIRLVAAVVASLGRARAPPERAVVAAHVDRGPALAALCAAVAAAPELAAYGPRADRIRLRECRTLAVDCDGTACADAASGAHRPGHRCTTLAVDLLARRFTQSCFSSTCAERRGGRPARSQPVSRALSDAIGAYLASGEWPLGEAVGADFCAAIGLDR